MTYTGTQTALERINEAFAELRAEGFDARGPSEDCTTCSMQVVPVGSAYVFWNEQAHERAFMIHDADEVPAGHVYQDLVLFAGHRTSSYLEPPAADEHELSQVAADRAVELLRGKGLQIEWSGDETDAIFVKPTSMDEFRRIRDARAAATT